MNAIIPFPDIGPDIFTINLGDYAFSLRWYAMAYIVGIVIGWRIALRAIRTPRLWPASVPPMTAEQIEDLLTWVVLGIVLGGRLGFVLFYQPGYYLSNPLEILMVWQGGMSFHGGMLGVALAGFLFCQRNMLPKLSVADTMALATAPGLFLGRIANFINAELWGRPTDMPWGVAFPGDAAQNCPDVMALCARHPSQLYEAGLEGLLLGGLLLYLAWSREWLRTPGQITGMFFVVYGVSRFIVEFFRQADAQFITPDNPMGYILQIGSGGMSMGQLLSFPMILFGLAMIRFVRTRS